MYARCFVAYFLVGLSKIQISIGASKLFQNRILTMEQQPIFHISVHKETKVITPPRTMSMVLLQKVPIVLAHKVLIGLIPIRRSAKSVN
jgi:hypothetical protein